MMSAPDPDGVDPRVIRAKADAAEIHAAGQDSRTYGTRMVLVTSAAVILIVTGFLVSGLALAAGLGVGVLVGLLFARSKRK
jgi:hypothetical protein